MAKESGNETAQRQAFAVFLCVINFNGATINPRPLTKGRKMKAPSDMFTGNVFNTTNYGRLEIIEYRSKYNVSVMFADTGSVCVCQSNHIRSGAVKDKFKPTAHGVGYFGDGKHAIPRNLKSESPYTAWRNMLRRCYDEEFHIKFPTYKDVTVCEAWHNYQNFAEWFTSNKPVDTGDWQVDKDIRVKGNRVYSPDTCVFALRKDNMDASLAKDYKFTSPSGLLVEVHNLSDFCKENKLHPSHMSAVHNGKLNQHKKWKKG